MKTIYVIPSEQRYDSTLHMALSLMRAEKQRGSTVAALSRKNSVVTAPLKQIADECHTAPLRGPLDPLSPVKLAKMLRDAPEGRTVIHTFRLNDAVIAARARNLASRPDIKIVVTRMTTHPAKSGVAATAIYSEIDALIFTTEQQRDTFLSTKPDIDAEKLLVIRPAVMLPTTDSGPIATKSSEVINITVCGKITAEKGLDTLIEALATIRKLPWKLTVVGEGTGPVVMPVIRKSRDLGISDRIDWKGYAITPLQATNAAHIAVCPDKSNTMMHSSIDLYTAVGVPVIASDTPLHKALAENTHGVTLFESGNSTALAEALTAAIEGVSTTEPSRQATDFDSFAREIQQLYLSLLS